MKLIRIEKCGECPYLYYATGIHRTDVVPLRCTRNGRINVITDVHTTHPDCPLPDAEKE